MARAKGLKAAMTKTQIFTDIAESTNLSRKDVAAVFAAMEGIIERHVREGSVGVCTIPGLMKNQDREEAGPEGQEERPEPVPGPGSSWM